MSGNGEVGSSRGSIVNNGRRRLLNPGLPRPVPPFTRIGRFFCGPRFRLFREWGDSNRDLRESSCSASCLHLAQMATVVRGTHRPEPFQLSRRHPGESHFRGSIAGSRGMPWLFLSMTVHCAFRS